MNNTLINKILNAPKGSFFGVTIRRPCKVFKTVTDTLEKEIELVARGGVQYDNITTVIEGREDGTKPVENAGLPFGQWVKYPYLIRHNGQDYIRLTLTPNNKVKVRYYKNGQNVTKSEIESLLLASETRESDTAPEVMTVKVDNLREVRV